MNQTCVDEKEYITYPDYYKCIKCDRPSMSHELYTINYNNVNTEVVKKLNFVTLKIK